MRIVHVVSALALAVGLAPGAMAQGVSGVSGPAETPPASYTGVQYVDSRGCVFVRAGYGGNVTWVPRVTRSRQQICGQSPTGGGGAVAVAAAEPVPVITPAPVPTAQRPVPAPGNSSTITTTVTVPVGARPVPTPELTPVIQTASAQPVRVASCQGLPAGAAQYMQGPGLRCGPQPVHPGDLARGLAGAGGLPEPRIPEGYRPAWQDDRLNPYRGLAYATPQGDAAMAAVWSSTVPRVPVDPAADGVGAVSRAANTPGLVITRASSTPDIAVEDEGAAAPATLTIPASHRYVQLGQFTDRAEAESRRAQLLAQGVPTALGGVERSGATTYLLLTGPYGSSQELGRALMDIRARGYGGAVTR